jgi:hypothetical protein
MNMSLMLGFGASHHYSIRPGRRKPRKKNPNRQRFMVLYYRQMSIWPVLIICITSVPNMYVASLCCMNPHLNDRSHSNIAPITALRGDLSSSISVGQRNFRVSLMVT